MKEVVYVDTDPWYGEYVIIRDGDKYHYAYIEYKEFEVTEIEEISGDINEFAWEHGLSEIDPLPLDDYVNKLKTLFK